MLVGASLSVNSVPFSISASIVLEAIIDTLVLHDMRSLPCAVEVRMP